MDVHQPLGTHARHHQHRPGAVDARRPAGRGRQGPGPDGRARRRAREGDYYRSDHFEFAKQGVPALDAKGGRDYIGKPDGYGQQKRDEYTENDYHKVSDEVKPDWDLSGAVEDARLLLEVGYRVAEGDAYPEWKPDSEFRARREAMLKAYKP